MNVQLNLTEEQARYVLAAIVQRNLMVLNKYERCYRDGNMLGVNDWLDLHDVGKEVREMITAQLHADTETEAEV